MRRQILSLGLMVMVIMILVGPGIALASASEHAEGEGAHEAVPWYRGFNLWKAINMTVLFVVLYKLLAVPIKRLLSERGYSIEEGLKNAEKAQIDARRELEDMSQRLAEAKTEIEQILSKGRADADREIGELNRTTAAAIEVLKKRVQDELAQDFLDARQELLTFVATEAVEMARQSLIGMDLKNLQNTYVRKFQETMHEQGGNGERS